MAKVEDYGFCNGDCNTCSTLLGKNSRAISFVLEALYQKFGEEAYRIIQDSCPNMTCCADCRIDDFSHVEGCEIEEKAKEFLAEEFNSDTE